MAENPLIRPSMSTATGEFDEFLNPAIGSHWDPESMDNDPGGFSSMQSGRELSDVEFSSQSSFSRTSVSNPLFVLQGLQGFSDIQDAPDVETSINANAFMSSFSFKEGEDSTVLLQQAQMDAEGPLASLSHGGGTSSIHSRGSVPGDAPASDEIVLTAEEEAWAEAMKLEVEMVAAQSAAEALAYEEEAATLSDAFMRAAVTASAAFKMAIGGKASGGATELSRMVEQGSLDDDVAALRMVRSELSQIHVVYAAALPAEAKSHVEHALAALASDESAKSAVALAAAADAAMQHIELAATESAQQAPRAAQSLSNLRACALAVRSRAVRHAASEAAAAEVRSGNRSSCAGGADGADGTLALRITKRLHHNASASPESAYRHRLRPPRQGAAPEENNALDLSQLVKSLRTVAPAAREQRAGTALEAENELQDLMSRLRAVRRDSVGSGVAARAAAKKRWAVVRAALRIGALQTNSSSQASAS
eukprot:CAMPEP_0170159680 /NCGR_PEP_ID=MMETSP0033_2-20121228/71383_1 /TAXON_ID=195969 /ORGANISM="Dolichomastix tenuilepis, Strain CCMP3274" /LENGTH=479 /DNA_ID=CAMNT_0010397177 /DNA_START=150 /DNA_END=1589 /DNA_ORIENTATION=-